MSLRVRVEPRAQRDELAGVRAGALRVRLKAPPLEGQANRALVRFLARALDVPAASIELLHGQSGREKLMRIAGLGPDDLRARLAPA